jgi:hypothetical protein
MKGPPTEERVKAVTDWTPDFRFEDIDGNIVVPDDHVCLTRDLLAWVDEGQTVLAPAGSFGQVNTFSPATSIVDWEVYVNNHPFAGAYEVKSRLRRARPRDLRDAK